MMLVYVRHFGLILIEGAGEGFQQIAGAGGPGGCGSR